MGIEDLRRYPMLKESGLQPRYQIAAIGIVSYVLQLASTALRKMTARWHLMMQSCDDLAVVRDSVPRDRERHVLA